MGKEQYATNGYLFVFSICFLPFAKQISIFKSYLFCLLQNALNFDKSKIGHNKTGERKCRRLCTSMITRG